MFIGEILSNFVDIFFLGNIEKYILQIRSLEVPKSYLAIIIRVNYVKKSHYYCICISILKLWSGL